MRQRAPKRPAVERTRLILESAEAVFAASGYAAAGTGDVARGAGIAPSALYRYFPGKRDLYLATLRNAAPRLLTLWGDRARAAADPLEAIRILGLEYYDHLQGRSDFARLWFRALAEADDPDVREIVAANFMGMVDAIGSLVRAAQQAGVARNDIDPRIAAWHFMAIGFTFDLVHHLALDAELDRGRVEAWGRLFIDSLREAPHEPSTAKTSQRRRRTLPVREPGGKADSARRGDPLPPLPASAPDSLGSPRPRGADG